MSIPSSSSNPDAARAADPGVDAVWPRLARAQVLRLRALTVLGVLTVLTLPWVASSWPEAGWVNQGIEWLGVAMIIVAVLGRCGCMLYLGGRKGADLVAQGPYSVSRNPLYVFSMLAVGGIGLQTGSLVMGVVLAALAFVVFRWIVSEEEQLLQVAFGASFDAYCAQVPRFWPRFSLWQSPRQAMVDLHGVWKTLRDALPYFLAIPVFEAVEFAQQSGWVHVHVRLF